jgi:hypothetical protein
MQINCRVEYRAMMFSALATIYIDVPYAVEVHTGGTFGRALTPMNAKVDLQTERDEPLTMFVWSGYNHDGLKYAAVLVYQQVMGKLAMCVVTSSPELAWSFEQLPVHNATT